MPCLSARQLSSNRTRSVDGSATMLVEAGVLVDPLAIVPALCDTSGTVVTGADKGGNV